MKLYTEIDYTLDEQIGNIPKNHIFMDEMGCQWSAAGEAAVRC